MKRRLGFAVWGAVLTVALTSCTEVARTRQEGTRRSDFLKERTQVALIAPGPFMQGAKLIDIDRGTITTIAIPTLKDFSPFGFVTDNRIVTVAGGSIEDPTSKAYAVPMSLDRPPKLLGSVERAFPSLTPGRVWLDWKPREKNGDYRHLLREVDLRGRQKASYEASLRRDLIDPVEMGFLTYLNVYDEDYPSMHPSEVHLEVWDPATGKTLRRLDFEGEVVATNRRTAALHSAAPIPGNPRIPGGPGEDIPPPCGNRCPIHLVDVVTGKDRQVPLPAGIEGVQADALFSPDGRSVAVTVQNLKEGFVGGLFIIDIETGRAVKILNASDVEYLGSWSPDGKWLFFARYQEVRQPGRIGAYRLGERQAKTLDLITDATSPLLAIPSRFIR